MDWQPIDTAPNETEVLIYDGYRRMVASLYYTREPTDYDNGVLQWMFGDVAVSPTHWMPLPEPPETSNQ